MNTKIYKKEIFQFSSMENFKNYFDEIYLKELKINKQNFDIFLSTFCCLENLQNIKVQPAHVKSLIYVLNAYIKEHTLKDLLSINIEKEEKNFNVAQLLISIIPEVMNSVLNENNIIKSYTSNSEETWKLILMLNKKDKFSEELITTINNLYNLNSIDNLNKNKELLLSIRSFNTLLKFQKNGFNIWQIVEKNELGEIKTLLPFYVSEFESTRRDLKDFSKMLLQDRAKIIMEQKSKWIDIPEVKENLNDYLTKFVLIMSKAEKEKVFTEILKDSNIQLKHLSLKMKDCYPLTLKTFTIKDRLLKSNKISTLKKIIHKNDNLIDDDEEISAIIKLVTTEHKSSHVANLTTTKNNFHKMWFSILKKTDFKEIRNGKNLLSQLLSQSQNKEIRCYLPIERENLENEDRNSSYNYFTNIITRLDSLLNILYFFKKQNVDFHHKYNDKLIFSDLVISLLTFENENKTSSLFKEKGLLWEEFKSFSNNEKEEIWKNFIDNWKIIWNEKRLNRYKEVYQICKYESPSSLVNAINMFIDLFFNNNSHLIKDWNKIKNDLIPFNNTSKDFINMINSMNILELKVNLETSLVEQKTTSKSIKI